MGVVTVLVETGMIEAAEPVTVELDTSGIPFERTEKQRILATRPSMMDIRGSWSGPEPCTARISPAVSWSGERSATSPPSPRPSRDGHLGTARAVPLRAAFSRVRAITVPGSMPTAPGGSGGRPGLVGPLAGRDCKFYIRL
ncbi:hypothetical protein MOQ72_20090 [Saccharopolyspora sp. K220]|nr:hypothetical protein [Saccharopolyspora soli]